MNFRNIKLGVATATACVLMSSCHASYVSVGEMTNEHPAVKVASQKNPFLLWGLVPLESSKQKADDFVAGSQNYKVKTSTEFVDGLLSFITLGIYSPTTTSYYLHVKHARIFEKRQLQLEQQQNARAWQQENANALDFDESGLDDNDNFQLQPRKLDISPSLETLRKDAPKRSIRTMKEGQRDDFNSINTNTEPEVKAKPQKQEKQTKQVKQEKPAKQAKQKAAQPTQQTKPGQAEYEQEKKKLEIELLKRQLKNKEDQKKKRQELEELKKQLQQGQ